EEELVGTLALDALNRRLRLSEHWLQRRLAEIGAGSKGGGGAGMSLLRSALLAELQMLHSVAAAVSAGPSGAEDVAAKAVAAREGLAAEAAVAQDAASNAAAVTAAAARSLSRVVAGASSNASLARPGRLGRASPAPVRVVARPPSAGPKTAAEEIQRWIQEVRRTGSVAAGGEDGDWRRQLAVVRAGLTGTAVCLGGDGSQPAGGKKLPPLQGAITVASRSLPLAASGAANECPICLEPLGSKPSDQLVPLPCGHAFHSACASQWLQRNPRCPMCRHSPFVPMDSGPATGPQHRSSPPWSSNTATAA
ncbi:unnamed protein product, partial [Polarella glacialis]